MSEEAIDDLKKIIEKRVPKEHPFYLYLYQWAPEKGAIGNVEPVDRNGDLLKQIKKVCIEEGLTGHRKIGIQIRGPQGFGKAGHPKKGDSAFESVVADVILPDPVPVAPPVAEQPRVPNPVALDPVAELMQHKARMKEIRAALEEDCADCGEPESKCTCPEERCDDPPDGCGLSLDECTCDAAEPSAFETAFQETFVSGKGKQLMEEAGDEVLGILKGIGRRISGGSVPAKVSGGVKVVSRKVAP